MTYGNLTGRLIWHASWRWYYYLRWLVLILLGLAVYSQTFSFGFVFDDNYFIIKNPCIRSFGEVFYVWKNFPLTRTIGFYTFAFNYWLNRLDPHGYHIVNFFIHLSAAGLIWACATRLFKIAGWGPCSQGIYRQLPFFIALLFLVHPCQTQAVTYISQRFESMATVFYLGSFYFYLKGRTEPSAVNKSIAFAGCIVFALLGIFTKEVAVTIPIMILAAELILFNREPAGAGHSRTSSTVYYICTVIFGLVLFVLFMKIVRTDIIKIYFRFSAPSESHDGDMITGGTYVLTQMRVFLTFLRLLIFPTHQNVDYDYPLSSGLWDPPLTSAGLGVMGLFVFLIFRLRRKWPLIAFGLSWILITFSINTAPRANLIFEHKLYLISFGFFLAAVCALSHIIKDRRILIGLLSVVIALLALISYQRNKVWRNELTLWNNAVERSGYKARPYNNRGLAYFYSGNLDQSLSDYNKAIALRPDYSLAYINRGLLNYKLGNFNKAIWDFNQVIKISPVNAESYNNLALAYYSLGNLPQAMFDYNKAIEKNPGYAEAYFNRAILFAGQGNFNQAMSDYDKAIARNPDYADAYYNRGLLCLNKGLYQQAVSDFSNAINENPANPEFYIERGRIFNQQSHFNQAIEDYNMAVKINPDNAQAYNNRGIAYSHQGSFSKALSDFNQAISINSHYADAYYNRAVIYFRLKDYDRALKDALKVEALGIKVDPEFIKTLKNNG